MSKESVQELFELMNAKDERVAHLMGAFVENDMNGSVVRLGAAAREDGWDVTDDELADAMFGAMELDDDELDSVAGGFLAAGTGGCKNNYYEQNCKDSVSLLSRCFGNDFCIIFTNAYDYACEKVRQSR